MPLRDERTQQAGRAADIAQRAVSGEIELLGERDEVRHGDTVHCAHELLESSGVLVEAFEHRLLTMLDLVLRTAGSQGLRQIVPELKEAGIEHGQDPTDVARAGRVQEVRTFRRVEVPGLGSLPFPIQKLHRHQRVKKIRDAARVNRHL